MIAIEISRYGEPDVLRPVERPVPAPAPGEILIRVAAAGVARADTLQRQGKYPPPPGASDIPGLDISGTVEAISQGVTRFKLGDRVCAILTGGGYAEFCAVPAVQALPIPENWTDVEAATLPENLLTAYDNVVTRAQLKSGETILIHGGTSGVGSTAIMLSRLWNAFPMATAGSAAKCEACLLFGARDAIPYRDADFSQEALALTNGRGVDVILDLVGATYLEKNLACLAVEGRIVTIASHGGRTAPLDFGLLMRKRARVMGSTLRVRTPEEKGAVAQAVERDVWPALPAKNPIRPVIDSTFPLEQAGRAHQRMEQGDHIGKIVLTVAHSSVL
jgi:putative PIG3 family NAD(P)H quinone oxidoreductase